MTWSSFLPGVEITRRQLFFNAVTWGLLLFHEPCWGVPGRALHDLPLRVNTYRKLEKCLFLLPFLSRR
jgi:hypothetical protein